MPPPGPDTDPAVRLNVPLVHNKFVEDVTPPTVGLGATVYAPDAPVALVGQIPEKFTVTLYAPVVLAVGVNDGDTLVALVVTAIPGPDHR